MIIEATEEGPITAAIITAHLAEASALEPDVLGHVVDGLNCLIRQLAVEWIVSNEADIRETMCGLVLADSDTHTARVITRGQCERECKANGVPLELGPAMPERLTVVLVTQRVGIVFGLPVTMTRIKAPGSENN